MHGISEADCNELGKPLIFDSNGQLTLNGDTGISAGVKDELASIIGQTRVIPIFSSVTGNGNNAQYRIVKWAGVRILAVRLTGAMSKKMVMVQPAPIISVATSLSVARRDRALKSFHPFCWCDNEQAIG